MTTTIPPTDPRPEALDQMMSGLHDKRIRALYLIGENPAQSEADMTRTLRLMEGLGDHIDQNRAIVAHGGSKG